MYKLLLQLYDKHGYDRDFVFFYYTSPAESQIIAARLFVMATFLRPGGSIKERLDFIDDV